MGYIEHGIEFEFTDGVENAHLAAVAAGLAIGVELDLEILVNLAVQVQTDIVQIEIVRPFARIGGFLGSGKTRSEAGAYAHPLGIVDFERRSPKRHGCVRRRQRRQGGGQKRNPQAAAIRLRRACCSILHDLKPPDR